MAAADEALRMRGVFSLVLAGGNTPRDVYELLRSAETCLPGWHIYFGDERCVPVDDPSLNSRMAELAWLDNVPIRPLQRHPIPAELGPREVTGASRSGTPRRCVQRRCCCVTRRWTRTSSNCHRRRRARRSFSTTPHSGSRCVGIRWRCCDRS
ncbi:MAG: 6-phosphogluconolactonase [Methylibium sp.]|nr:6-phosphogluconolactonase [Methylibium sp.]